MTTNATDLSKITMTERDMMNMAVETCKAREVVFKKTVKRLREANTKLKTEKKQWEPEWKSQAEANAAGYNQAQTELTNLKTENARLKDRLSKAVSFLRQGKAQFAPYTTNSDVDVFLEEESNRE
jgi:predicted nuclease with TOPRIM domain